MRVISIAVAGLVTIASLKAVSLVSLDLNTSPIEQEASGFGEHDRPWARDLLKGKGAAEKMAAADAGPASSAEGDEGGQCMDAGDLTSIVAGAEVHLEATNALKIVQKQQAALAAREADLVDASVILTATEQRLNDEMVRLVELREETKALIDQLVDLEEEDLKRMVAIYQNMKAKEAAAILEEMDTDIVVAVVDRMPERRSAPIISELSVRKARAVMQKLADRRRVTEINS